MTAGNSRIAAALAAVLLVAACGGGEGGQRLMNFQHAGNGPDEFSILPTKPLEMPADFKNLPEPTPGRANRTDPNPLNDAVVALGGRPGAGSADPALVAAAGRHGVSPSIRGDLAAEDSAFRAGQSPRFLERLFGSSSYHRVYSGEANSSYNELDRFRARGAQTPSAPPAGLKED